MAASGGAAGAAPDGEEQPGGERGDDRASTPRRIALLVRKWSVRGGNERVATEVARYLSGRGHQVLVLCQKVDASASHLGLDVEVRTLMGASFDPTLAICSFAWAARRAVRRLRVRGEVDIVLGFNHTVEQDVYRLGGGTHAAYLEQLAGRSRSPVLDRVALTLEQARFQPANYRRLIAPSEHSKRELLLHYPVPEDKIHVVYNGVDLSRFRPRPELRAEVLAELSVSPDARVALFVGQDLERKGFDQAQAATAALSVPLLYVGQARRPAQLGAHVVWVGERRDIERFYAAADVLVLPSRYDPFGGAVLEAYACGLPAVATRRIGATELARGSGLGDLLVDDPDDLDGLIEALRRAMAPPPGGWAPIARGVSRDRGPQAFGRDLEAVLLAL